MDKNKTYLEEAFKALDSLSLTEDVFELTTDGLEDANDFMNMDFDEVEDIIDVEASDKEELKDSYIGNVILDCNVCHSKLYKKLEDVIIDENEVANIEEACPYCQSNDGYVVIGQVAEYCSHCEDEDNEEEKEEDSDEIEVDETEEEKIEESLKESKQLNEEVPSEAYDVAEYIDNLAKDRNFISFGSFNGLFDDAVRNLGVAREIYQDADFESDVRGILSFKGWETIFEGEDEGGIRKLEESKKSLKEMSLYDLRAENDSRASFHNKAIVDINDENGEKTLYSYNTPVVKLTKEKEIKLLPKWDSSATTLRHVKEFLKQNGFKADSLKQIRQDYLKESSTRDKIDADADNKKEIARKRLARRIDDADADRDYKLKKDGLKESDKPAAISIEDAQKWVDYDMKKYGKISGRTNRLVKKAGFQILKDDHGDYEVAAGKFESCNEDFEKVEIETDKEKMSMTAEENGKVTVTTEPKEEIKEEEKAEVIEPVSDEVKAEFKTTEEESEEDKYADIDIDEFDEEEFDSLGEQYLKRVYENVKSFKTTKGSVNENTLKLEGLITFKSGKQVKTNFVFEARTITKTGKLKFIGENKQFAKGKKSFILTGKMNANKLVVESFTYNYKSKDPKSGQIKKLYGRVAK